jgi:hypothetical protein
MRTNRQWKSKKHIAENFLGNIKNTQLMIRWLIFQTQFKGLLTQLRRNLSMYSEVLSNSLNKEGTKDNVSLQ